MTATAQAAAAPAPTASRLGVVSAALARHPLALSLVLAALTCPFPTATPSFGLDASWGFALHAWVSGSAGDVPVTYFTYGPLGFLAVPVVWARSTYALALLFTLGVQVALCRLLLARARRVCPFPVAVLAVLLLAALAATSSPEMMLVAVVLAVAELLEAGTRTPRLVLLGGTALSGLALLVKFSTGLVCLAALVLLALVLAGPGARRRVLTAAGTGAASLLVSWAAFGALTGHPLAFGRWLRASTQIAGGYVAMAYEYYDGSTTVDYAYAVPVVLAVVGLGGALLLRERTPARAGSTLLLALVTALLFREGFTRHDPLHLGIFVGAMLLLPFALPLGRRGRWVLPPLLLTVLVLGLLPHRLGRAVYPGERWDLAGNVVRLGDRISLLWDAAPTQARGRADIEDNFQVPGDVVAALRGHRVQVDPFDTAAVWTYGLRWGPSAVWQLYTSYTPWLDDANAASLRAPTAPDRLLRRVDTMAIDGRRPAFESPAYQLEELCHWRSVVADGAWEVLERGPDRCGAPEPLSTARLVPGQPVAVPQPARPGDAVTVRLRLDLPWSYRVATALFKPWRGRVVRVDGQPFRLVVRTAGQPLPVVVPGSLVGVPGGTGGVSSGTLTTDLPGTAVFEELPVSP